MTVTKPTASGIMVTMTMTMTMATRTAIPTD